METDEMLEGLSTLILDSLVSYKRLLAEREELAKEVASLEAQRDVLLEKLAKAGQRGKEKGAHDYITVIDCACLSPLADNITPRFDAFDSLAPLEGKTTGVSSYRHFN